MSTYPHVVGFIRSQQDAYRLNDGRAPVTDRELLNMLLAMKYFEIAEWFACDRRHELEA